MQLAKSEQCTCCTNITLTYTTKLTYLQNLSFSSLILSFRFIEYDGWSYTGGYKQDKYNGKGEYEFADRSREIAYYIDDKKEGAARYYDKNGKKEDRFYKDDELVEQ